MRVNYKGTDTELKRPLAEIAYTEKETHLLDRMIKVMTLQGYSIDTVAEGYAQCIVDDRADYVVFMSEWKKVKRSVKMWEKYGF